MSVLSGGEVVSSCKVVVYEKSTVLDIPFVRVQLVFTK